MYDAPPSLVRVCSGQCYFKALQVSTHLRLFNVHTTPLVPLVEFQGVNFNKWLVSSLTYVCETTFSIRANVGHLLNWNCIEWLMHVS